jgi:hypothetical protein
MNADIVAGYRLPVTGFTRVTGADGWHADLTDYQDKSRFSHIWVNPLNPNNLRAIPPHNKKASSHPLYTMWRGAGGEVTLLPG